MTFRLYTFVANHYLSPLQCGLQTAHVVGELSRQIWGKDHRPFKAYTEWAGLDKTIIICAASNHRGVMSAWTRLVGLAKVIPGVPYPVALFCEDEQSMNNMATACGIIVSDRIYNANVIEVGEEKKYGWFNDDSMEYEWLSDDEAELADYIKSFKLA